ncbi:MAG: prepilin-type N-terminal cleavage/methylation domain-containing protein [Burkholderiaceae bacterium]|jgi:type IV fimbrial biogenesis protein FimT|nr:prepilin-type N-terminal cleavage/methylation domain-containing protein [Burkholderiaceae bacterium]
MGRRGFTLVELLVVLAVGSILLAIAVPGYAFLVNGSRLTTVTNDLVAALHFTRSEAIKRGMRVTLCKTGSAMAAAPSCDDTASWEQGWLVFVDGGTRGTIDSGDALLWTQGSASSAVTITTSNYGSYVSYLPSGRSQGSNGLANGTLRICAAGNRRDIIINATGRPRLSSATC